MNSVLIEAVDLFPTLTALSGLPATTEEHLQTRFRDRVIRSMKKKTCNVFVCLVSLKILPGRSFYLGPWTEAFCLFTIWKTVCVLFSLFVSLTFDCLLLCVSVFSVCSFVFCFFLFTYMYIVGTCLRQNWVTRSFGMYALHATTLTL